MEVVAHFSFPPGQPPLFPMSNYVFSHQLDRFINYFALIFWFPADGGFYTCWFSIVAFFMQICTRICPIIWISGPYHPRSANECISLCFLPFSVGFSHPLLSLAARGKIGSWPPPPPGGHRQSWFSLSHTLTWNIFLFIFLPQMRVHLDTFSLCSKEFSCIFHFLWWQKSSIIPKLFLCTFLDSFVIFGPSWYFSTSFVILFSPIVWPLFSQFWECPRLGGAPPCSGLEAAEPPRGCHTLIFLSFFLSHWCSFPLMLEMPLVIVNIYPNF